MTNQLFLQCPFSEYLAHQQEILVDAMELVYRHEGFSWKNMETRCVVPQLSTSSIPRQKYLPAPPAPKLLKPAAVDRTVVLLGKTGCGKSLLGNVMLKRYGAFKSECSTSSVTKGVHEERARIVAPDGEQMDLQIHDTQGPRLSLWRS